MSFVLARVMHTSEPKKPKRLKAKQEMEKEGESENVEEEKAKEDTVPLPAFDDRSVASVNTIIIIEVHVHVLQYAKLMTSIQTSFQCFI